jgi:hypothetical protein
VTGTICVVENTVQVTVRDLDQRSDLLKRGGGCGANSIYGISLMLRTRKRRCLKPVRTVDDASPGSGPGTGFRC